jgi:uncharacterized repeat protein (TIGR02543 family)
LKFSFQRQALDKAGDPMLSATGQYLGTTYDTTTKTYTTVPDYVQKAMAQQSLSDFTIDNFGLSNWVDATTDPTLYTRGRYKLDLSRIRESVSGVGYSVEVDKTTGKLVDSYTYSVPSAGSSGVTVVDANGDPVAVDTGKIGTVYVALRPVIIPSDVDAVITTGDSVDALKTRLIESIKDHDGKTVPLTSSDVTIDTSKVDNTKPGQYPITYTYVPDGVSYTVEVTVKAPAAEVYTVSFDSRGGSSVQSERVTSGDKATKPADPTRNGYTFAGWNTKSDGTGDTYDFTKPVTENTVLYAQWKADAGADTASADTASTNTGAAADAALAHTGSSVTGFIPAIIAFAVSGMAVTSFIRRRRIRL